jgi:aminopeptidase N
MDLKKINFWNNKQIEEYTYQKFVFENCETKPILSINREFSAPVILDFEQSIEDQLYLFEHDDDSFNRWEAGQRLAVRSATTAIESGTTDAVLNAAYLAFWCLSNFYLSSSFFLSTNLTLSPSYSLLNS